MMRVFHCDSLGIESASSRQFANPLRVIVCHQEIALNFPCGIEEIHVVQFVVAIQTFPCLLAIGGIRWINEKNRLSTLIVLADLGYTITFDDGKSFTNTTNRINSVRKGFRIPTRQKSFPILAMLDKARARRQDTAMKHSILQYRPKGNIIDLCRCL
uniref:Uncharacterized protein n=1 Tax=Candidatus Kentrum sp. UNK TaxID=2126344 RepID=A0A451AB45_9GAMM|nr:MAG: hypothetical protein BECKUNK1418G_GA0071005_10319 [Candidatus Kentron sp. UNK]VFK70776.1 MAG: hypothetical protein BECKUNK1418H_GA0071006_10389 [Candidatus Kentron sp. UNK]